MVHQPSTTFTGFDFTQSSFHSIAPSDRSPAQGVQEIERLVKVLVATWHSSAQILESRRWHRTEYDKPLIITPLDNDTDAPLAQPLLAAGRNISLGGISFSHDLPLPYRKVAITFPLGPEVCDSAITRLTWCRFTRQGYYQSGGKFLRTIHLPGIQQVDLTTLPKA